MVAVRKNSWVKFNLKNEDLLDERFIAFQKRVMKHTREAKTLIKQRQKARDNKGLMAEIS